MIENTFLILNILGLAIYLNLIPVHLALTEIDRENGISGIFKRGRFSTGILLIYLVFLSKSFGWDGFFGFGRIGIPAQLIWLFWNFRSEVMTVTTRFGVRQSAKLGAYNFVGISTLIYQIVVYFIYH